MASKSQAEYIRDLAIKKLKEFKEFKELLVAENITDGETALKAGNISDAVHALTDLQASRLIDILAARQTPKRSTSYSTKRVKGVVEILDAIKRDIDNWDFE